MATITEDYVSFDAAKLLKEKGFDSEDCFAFYKKNGEIGFLQTFGDITDYVSETCVIAPTLQMVLKWLREVHNIFIIIEPHKYDYINERNSSCIASLWQGDNYYENITSKDYPTYEEACEETIKFSLKNLI